MKDIVGLSGGSNKQLLTDIATQIVKSDSFTLTGIPGVGKSLITRFLVTKEYYELYNIPQEVLIITIDANDLLDISVGNFYRYLYKSIYKLVKASEVVPGDMKDLIKANYTSLLTTNDTFILYEEIKDILSDLTIEGFRIVLIFDEFNKLFKIQSNIFDNLKALRDINKNQISIGVVGDLEIISNLQSEKLGSLGGLISHKVLYIRPTESDEIRFTIDNIFSHKELPISEDIKDVIFELSGGHIGYIKSLTKIYNETPELFDTEITTLINELSKTSEIISRGETIWKKISIQDRESITRKGVNVEQHLLSSGMINDEGKLFSPLLEKFAIDRQYMTEKKSNARSFEIVDGQVYHDRQALNIDFTKTESQVLEFFIKNIDKVVSRDQIAKVMWGDEVFQKYSDYAIDRLISRLRKKMNEDASAPKHLKTIKGVGFKFQN